MNGDSCSNNKGRCALVVEGGAMRGIFSAGILDAFLEKGFNPFDICIGVSAGANNLASYLAGMYRRNHKLYTHYSIGRDFISLWKFFKGGHLVDLDWLWDITIREIRLDMETIFGSGKEFFIGVTDVKSGKAVYLQPDSENLEEMLKASSAIPVFYRKTVLIDGTEYADGGMTDSIPVIEAYKRGAQTIVVLRSRPYSYKMKPSSNSFIKKLYLKKNPGILQAVNNRAKVYQEAMDFMRNPPTDVKIIEVNPPEEFKTKRLTTKVDILEQDYKLGYEAGLKIIAEWNGEISSTLSV